MRNIFIFCLINFVWIQNINAQMTTSEKTKLSGFLSEYVNELRVGKGLFPLKRSDDLSKAAELHSDYMADRNTLTHVEIKTDYPNPKDRVHNFNKEFIGIGENVLFTKPKTFPLNDNELKKLAFEMFRSWKGSAGHYANMMSLDYTYGDFGFSYHIPSKRVFATQVFAKKGYIIDGQLSQDAFSIKANDITCNDLIGNRENLVVNIGNSITIENNEVFLRHHNIQNIKGIFENSNDGIAVDLVARNQLPCDDENRLDLSEIYEGVMLKPVYKDALFSGNISQNPNRLIVSLGKIPEYLQDQVLSPNIILIKDGRKCSYAVSAMIPSKGYELRPIEPLIIKPEIQLKTEGVNGIMDVEFDFASGKTIPLKTPKVNFEGKMIHSIDIKSFTSVDGNEKVNELLHNDRARYIEDFLLSKLNKTSVPINIDAKENWELCFYHLEILGLDKTLQQDKSAIRNYIQNHKDTNWEDALQLQRKSKAIVYTYGTWSADDFNMLTYNLTDALITKNYKLANKVLAEMYEQDNENLFLNEEFIIDKLFDKQELVQNVSALLLKNIHNFKLDNVVFFVRNWLSKPELLSADAQINLLNLYTITSRQLLRNWDSSTEDFSKVMHPSKVEPLFHKYKSKDVINPLFLNFHMTAIQYYGQINATDKIEKSFNFIIKYFRSEAISIEDDIALCLFFNSWSRFDLTLESLWSRYEYDELNEESCFLLAKTLVAYKNDSYRGEAFDIHQIAIKFNRERWCEWIDSDFQNLRNEGVKNLFCNTCSK